MLRLPKSRRRERVGNNNKNRFRTIQKSKLWNQPGTTTSWRPNWEKHIDNNINFKRELLSATVNQTKTNNPTPNPQPPQPLTSGRAVSYQVIKYNIVIGQ